MPEKIKNYVESLTGKRLFSDAKALQKSFFSRNIELNAGFPFLCEENRIKEELKNFTQQNIIFKAEISAHQHEYPNVKNIIAVASGKGGVGKSTVTVNLALALQAQGAKVAILDADVFGPSIALMLGGAKRPEALEGQRFIPNLRYGIQSISLADLLNDDEQAVIWRGPLVTQTLLQLLRNSAWEDVDYLLLDLPPSTGDIPLTLAQQIPMTGVVLVTTPQEVALLDARKAKNMFDKVSVPILGVVENMAYYHCENCQHQEALFGSDGGKQLASRYGVPLLASLPLNKNLRIGGDLGKPAFLDGDEAIKRLYEIMAFKLMAEIANLESSASPDISFE